ncbi:MAG: hypothetical protein AT715_05190 [Thermoproteus sp. JCHS_4]|nr:MAG: hypothetical protein AT715_05190 [Thermoproteus sp. JCHS_4]
MIETFEWLRGISARWDLANSGVWPLDYREYLAEPGVDLADAVSQTYGADRGSIALTSGAQEGNFLALWALRKKARRAVVFLPEYEPIYRLPSELGYETATASGDPLQRVEGGAVILLSNPNNPTGRYLDVRRLRELADEARRRGSYLVVDAVFADFVDDPRGLPEEAAVFNFSTDKFFTSSVRVGWSLGDREVVRAMAEAKDLFNPGPKELEARAGYGFLARRAEVKRRNAAWISENWAALRRAVGTPVEYREHMPVAFLRLGYDGEEAARRLLARGVASVPGRFFGVRDALRVGLARVRPEEFKEPLAALAEEVGRCA